MTDTQMFELPIQLFGQGGLYEEYVDASIEAGNLPPLPVNGWVLWRDEASAGLAEWLSMQATQRCKRRIDIGVALFPSEREGILDPVFELPVGHAQAVKNEVRLAEGVRLLLSDREAALAPTVWEAEKIRKRVHVAWSLAVVCGLWEEPDDGFVNYRQAVSEANDALREATVDNMEPWVDPLNVLMGLARRRCPEVVQVWADAGPVDGLTEEHKGMLRMLVAVAEKAAPPRTK